MSSLISLNQISSFLSLVINDSQHLHHLVTLTQSNPNFPEAPLIFSQFVMAVPQSILLNKPQFIYKSVIISNILHYKHLCNLSTSLIFSRDKFQEVELLGSLDSLIVYCLLPSVQLIYTWTSSAWQLLFQPIL